MSIPPIQTRPIISQLAGNASQSSPRARHAHAEATPREVKIEKGDSFEKREVNEINAQDSAKLRRVAAQKKHEAISAPPTPLDTPGLIAGSSSPGGPAVPTTPNPPVVGDRLAPTPGVDPTSTRIVPSQPLAPTPTEPAPIPPVIGDRLAPTNFDPTSTGIVPSQPFSPTPTEPAPLPPVVGDRLAPTPETEKDSNSVVPSSDGESHSTDSVDEDHDSTGAVDNDDDEHSKQVFTKADMDRLLGAFGRTSEQKGFTPGLDLNADGVINSSDLAALLSRFDNSQTPATQTPAEQLRGLLDAFGTQVKSNGPNGVYDYNGDGSITASDLAELLSRLSSTGVCAPSGAKRNENAMWSRICVANPKKCERRGCLKI